MLNSLETELNQDGNDILWTKYWQSFVKKKLNYYFWNFFYIKNRNYHVFV